IQSIVGAVAVVDDVIVRGDGIGYPADGKRDRPGVGIVAGAGEYGEPIAGDVLDIRAVAVAQPIAGAGNGPACVVAAEVVLPESEHVALFNIWQNERLPESPAAAAGRDGCARGGADLRAAGAFAPGKFLDGVVVGVHGQADLLEVVLALGAGGRLADLLDGGHQQADQDGDDG